jgi:hypothetical protein
VITGYLKRDGRGGGIAVDVHLGTSQEHNHIALCLLLNLDYPELSLLLLFMTHEPLTKEI